MSEIGRSSWGWWPPAVAVAAILAVWQAYATSGAVAAYILPSPLSILTAAVAYAPLLASGAATTLSEALGGLVIGFVAGSVAGILLARSARLRNAAFPLLVALDGTPKIALAPMIVVWLGIGYGGKVALVALLVFFPTVVQLARGLRSINEELELWVRSLCAPPWRVLVKVRIPAALPYIFDALRLSIPAAMIGAIVAEFISSERGLGNVLWTAVGDLNMALAFAALASMGLMSALAYLALVPFERRFLRWLPPGQR